ncbi:MAG TPA: hypothetical protein VMW49_02325 [Candidatus Dormibacteraeota bacterium]|nr:hypothetical protein [Candidatus Dormibacteraeota bacterium]
MRNSLAGLFSLLPAKAAAAAVAVTLVAAGGTAAVATHTITLPNLLGGQGKSVTTAVFDTCAPLLPSPRPSGTTGAATPSASPGAFGQCVSGVARNGHGQGSGSANANANGAAGQAKGQAQGQSSTNPGSSRTPAVAATHGPGTNGTGQPTPPAGPLS